MNNLLHILTKGHWFTPHVIGYDRYGFDEWDGCETCLEKES